MRFGISSLMGLVFVTAVICGVAMRGSIIAFGIGFVAFMVLLLHMMEKPGSRPMVVHEATSEAEAHLLRNLLVDQGVAARIEGDHAPHVYLGVIRPRVVVPPEQVERARQLMQELRRNE